MRSNIAPRALCFLALSALTAAPSPAADKWLALRSPNFEMYAQTGERSARDTLLYFENVRGFFRQAFANINPTLPVRIIAFNSEKEFRPYSPNEAAAAFYQAGQGRDTIVMGKIAEDVRPVAVHEYVHLLIRHSGMKIPAWLNEGLAELYSTMKPVGKQVQVGALVPGSFQLLHRAKWLPLETLTAVDHESAHYNERDRAGMFYAESWALVHMLALDEPYRPGFAKLLAALEAGHPPATSFQAVYNKSLDAIQKDLEFYVKRSDRFRVALFDIKLEKSAEQPDTAPADMFDVNLALAGLLERRQPDEARTRYESLARDNTTRPEPHEALAILAIRTGPQAAKDHFARAVELGSKNPNIYWSYALSIQSDESAAETLIGTLEKLLAMEPTRTDARLFLGERLVRSNRYQQALAHLSQIKQIGPEIAPRFFYTYAFASIQAGDLKAAKDLATQSQKYSKSPQEMTRAQQLLTYIDQREKAAARAVNGPQPSAPPPPAAPGDERSPRLARRELPPVPEHIAKIQPAKEDGVIIQLDCLGEQARLVATVDGKRRAYFLDEPGRVIIRNIDGIAMDFTCGPQKEQKVTIDYLPLEDAEHGTVGLLRGLEFH